MSFNQNETNVGYKPGFFLAHEECTRETRQIAQNHAQVVTADGKKHVPMGAIYPANDATAVGIVYEDVDVTTGAMPGSVVTAGTVYLDRLPAAPASAAKTALEGLGIKFITAAPGITRPDFNRAALAAITVASAAGTAAGDTKLTLSGYTPAAGESYKYKVGDTAPAVGLYEVLDNTWTAWNGTADITAATGKEITVASVDATGAAVAAGNATVTAKS